LWLAVSALTAFAVVRRLLTALWLLTARLLLLSA
jgi:hypothetical protein